MISKKSIILCFLILLNSAIPLNTHPYGDDEADQALTIGAVVIAGAGIATVLYGVTWASARLNFYSAQKRYQPEMDLLARSEYNPAIISEELVPFILRRHYQEGARWFGGYQGDFKNYPLLYYKNRLESYINSLSFLKFFVGSQKRAEIRNFVSHLERILDVLVTDYRVTKEQRDFEQFMLQKNLYATMHTQTAAAPVAQKQQVHMEIRVESH